MRTWSARRSKSAPYIADHGSQVLEEVRRPPKNENKVFIRAARCTIFLTTFFYMMVNVSLVRWS